MGTSGGRKTSGFFGWRVVWASFVLASFGWGVGFYGPPVFLHAVMERTGWPLALVSAAVTFHFLFGALVVANLPRLYRRFGVPRMTLSGAVLLALGVLGWSLAAAPWQLFLAATLSGAGWVAMGAAAINAIIAPWFHQRRPAALSMAYNGSSFGGILLSPLWVALIAAFDFTTAAAMVGLAMIAVVWVLSASVFSRTPESLGQAPDGKALSPATPGNPVSTARSLPGQSLPGRALYRGRTFRTLAAGMALGLFAQIGMIAHLFSILAPALGAQNAGLAMGFATACAIAGRSIVGWALPATADRRVVAATCYGVQIAGVLLLMSFESGNTTMILLGVALFGAGIGNATSLPPLIAQAEFAKQDVQRVVAMIVATGQATYAFAPAAYGALRGFVSLDLGLPSGGDTVFFAAVAAVQVLAIACFLAGRRPSSSAPPA